MRRGTERRVGSQSPRVDEVLKRVDGGEPVPLSSWGQTARDLVNYIEHSERDLSAYVLQHDVDDLLWVVPAGVV